MTIQYLGVPFVAILGHFLDLLLVGRELRKG